MVSKTPTKKKPTTTATTTATPSPLRGRPQCGGIRGQSRSPSSPLKRLASSLYRSAKPCIRRLATAFSHLYPHHHRRRHRLRLLKSLQDSHPLHLLDLDLDGVPLLSLLPIPFPPPHRPTAFLDLDETLVHSTPHLPPPRYDFSVRPTIDGVPMTFYVLERPGLRRLLAEASRSFELVAFTAGLRQYASLVLDRIDPGGVHISHRLYRDSCRELEGGGGRLVKDLSRVGRELHRVVIVDDNPSSYSLQPENAIPVRPFVVDDPADRELDRLAGFFRVADRFDDMRDAVRSFLATTTREEGGGGADVAAAKV